MTRLLTEIGQELVQEATYCDIVHAKNLPEAPKNMDTYKQARFLMPFEFIFILFSATRTKLFRIAL